jgi:putative addiction module killer protein
MNTLIKSSVFADWQNGLKDDVAKAHILRRLANAELGHFGDCESLGGGVSEMRIHFGPGYRIYFTRHGQTVYVLLCGGSKASQKRDIRQALKMARDLEGQEL